MSIRFKRKVNKANNNLRFGDLIYVDDRSFWNLSAHVIRYVERGGKFSKNKFTPNHNMMVIEEHPNIDEVKIIQANWVGVNIKPLKLWLQHKKVNVIIKRYKRDLRHKSEEKMRTWTLQQLGKGYDFGAIAGIYGRYLMLKYIKSKFIRWLLKGKRNPLSSKKRFICSEFMFLIYLRARIKLWKKSHYTNVTPYDEFRNKNFYQIFKKSNYEYIK